MDKMKSEVQRRRRRGLCRFLIRDCLLLWMPTRKKQKGSLKSELLLWESIWRLSSRSRKNFSRTWTFQEHELWEERVWREIASSNLLSIQEKFRQIKSQAFSKDPSSIALSFEEQDFVFLGILFLWFENDCFDSSLLSLHNHDSWNSVSRPQLSDFSFLLLLLQNFSHLATWFIWIPLQKPWLLVL